MSRFCRPSMAMSLIYHRFQTYFPHVDNIYSHRSTQKYKRKPFVSHYWDCRLKGRPPGTPKSNDPNKKRRRRTARERDLCDVKIKITEYFPEASMADFESSPRFELPSSTSLSVDLDSAQGSSYRGTQSFGVLTPNPALPVGHPGATGQKYFTIQRVNGNGGNGKADGIGGSHRHTLEDSDGVKKNSVQRFFLKEAKDKKKVMVGTFHLICKCFGITITVCKFCTSLTCRNCQSYLCKSFVEILDINPEVKRLLGKSRSRSVPPRESSKA